MEGGAPSSLSRKLDTVAETAQADAVRLIEAQLQRGPRHLTLTEASAVTGLSLDATRHAMEGLLTRYVCRLQASENGDLIYDFGASLRRRGAKTAAERRQALLDSLWRLFTVVYKACIAVVLVVYFVVFIVFLIAIVVAISSQQSNDDRGRGSGRAGLHPALIADLFFSIFRWRTITGSIDYQRDAYGYRYRHYEPRPAVLNAKKKNFIAAVYDFVFGPPRVEPDPLGNEKEVAAYLRQNKGLVTAAELSALAGWTFAQAETFLADCVVRYRGETKISEEAVLYGQFDEIIRGVGEVETEPVVYYWDEYEPDYELTGNSAGHNTIIIVMNLVNLLVAFGMLTGAFAGLFEPGLANAFLSFMTSDQFLPRLALGWAPFLFSVVFFLVPGLRWFNLGARRRRQHRQNIRKRFFRVIFARQGRAQTVSEAHAAVNRGASEETLSAAEVETWLKELVLDLPGEMTVSDQADLEFAFPRLTTEFDVIERLRQGRDVDDTLGDILIESDN